MKNQRQEIKNLVTKTLLSASSQKPIDSKTMAEIIKAKFNLETYATSRVRDIINELRREEVPVLSNHYGSWIEYNEDAIIAQIVSMQARIDIQISALMGVKACLSNVRYEKQIIQQ
jgi:hypothetical protein